MGFCLLTEMMYREAFTCADPESFVRVGPTLTFLFCLFFVVDEGGIIQISLLVGQKIVGHKRSASETPF